MNTINWQKKALKQMRKLSAQTSETIAVAVKTELSDLSAARNVKALTNHQYGYRLRVGNYRVFFEFDGAVSVVYVEEVKKRDEQTY